MSESYQMIKVCGEKTTIFPLDPSMHHEECPRPKASKADILFKGNIEIIVSLSRWYKAQKCWENCTLKYPFKAIAKQQIKSSQPTA